MIFFFLASNLTIQLRPVSIPMSQFWMHLKWLIPQSIFCWFTLLSSSCTVANLQRSSLASKKSLSPAAFWAGTGLVVDLTRFHPRNTQPWKQQPPVPVSPLLSVQSKYTYTQSKGGKQRHRAVRKVQLYSQLERKCLGASKWQLKQQSPCEQIFGCIFYMVMIRIYYLTADSMFSLSQAPAEDASPKSW